MTQEILTEVQDYLTVITGDHKKRIIDVQMLLRTHSTRALIQFMRGLSREYEKKLRVFITTDKTNPEMDKVIATLFRIHMSIKALEGEEVKGVVRFKPRAKKSGKFQRRNRSRHSRPRQRKDPNHDGEDRHPGHETQCGA